MNWAQLVAIVVTLILLGGVGYLIHLAFTVETHRWRH